jgi:hypothetical protein
MTDNTKAEMQRKWEESELFKFCEAADAVFDGPPEQREQAERDLDRMLWERCWPSSWLGRSTAGEALRVRRRRHDGNGLCMVRCLRPRGVPDL